MPLECRIVDASDSDIAWVIDHMRPEHRREIRDQSGLLPHLGVLLSVQDSSRVFSGHVGDKPLFLCGVSRKSLLSDNGSVWMVATRDIDDHPYQAIQALTALFAQAHSLAGAAVLEQLIPAWYRKGLKWLLWLGWKAVGTCMVNGVPHVHLVHEETAA